MCCTSLPFARVLATEHCLLPGFLCSNFNESRQAVSQVVSGVVSQVLSQRVSQLGCKTVSTATLLHDAEDVYWTPFMTWVVFLPVRRCPKRFLCKPSK